MYTRADCFRENIVYPSDSLYLSDEKIKEYLSIVEMEYLLDRLDSLDEVRDWDMMLSVGEQQKIGLCRILCHKPLYAIMVL